MEAVGSNGEPPGLESSEPNANSGKILQSIFTSVCSAQEIGWYFFIRSDLFHLQIFQGSNDLYYCGRIKHLTSFEGCLFDIPTHQKFLSFTLGLIYQQYIISFGFTLDPRVFLIVAGILLQTKVYILLSALLIRDGAIPAKSNQSN